LKISKVVQKILPNKSKFYKYTDKLFKNQKFWKKRRQIYQIIENYGKYADKFLNKLKITQNVLTMTSLLKNKKSENELSIISKNENFEKCTDKFSKKLKISKKCLTYFTNNKKLRKMW